jgi:hypothetical protein
MLTDQLDMFETGRLSLMSADKDLAPAAIAKLKREIGEFDTLICKDEARGAAKAHHAVQS